MTQEYKVLARFFRPKLFSEVIGQETIVTTLKNAIQMKRIAHAYLFCGPHGTGKTTFARLFAKVLNCDQLNTDNEPCNECASCREIDSGVSLQVLEIDGASNRGIDDIRQINETVTYAGTGDKYKIYIIDEVHMLTKEAFNALLKTLEEPPPKVKFFFATTEPHKLLPTILSRCQRFDLSRISSDKIQKHLLTIASKLKFKVKEDAAYLIAKHSHGSLRDALSLFDRIIAFQDTEISTATVSKALGLLPLETFLTFDQQAKKGDLLHAVELICQVFESGKNLTYFLEQLAEHFHTILLCKLLKKNTYPLTLNDTEWQLYQPSTLLYSEKQCTNILTFINQCQEQMKSSFSKKITLECLLIQIIQSHHTICISELVHRLEGLEQSLNSTSKTSLIQDVPPSVNKKIEKPVIAKPLPQKTSPKPQAKEDVKKGQARYDTIMQFAAVELEGSIKKSH